MNTKQAQKPYLAVIREYVAPGIDEFDEAWTMAAAEHFVMKEKLKELYEWLDDIGDGAPDASQTQKRALNEAAEIRSLLGRLL